MNPPATLQACDLVIALVNFVESLAVPLPVAGLLACGLIAASRHTNRQQDNARRASAKAPSRFPVSQLSQLAQSPRHPQPKPGTALIIAV